MKAWVYQIFSKYSVHCIFQTESNETGDKILSSIHLQNDANLPYFDNKTNIGEPIKIGCVNNFVIEPYYSGVLSPKNGERFYVYPDLE